MADLIDIKVDIRNGLLKPEISKGKVYLCNQSGEKILIVDYDAQVELGRIINEEYERSKSK